MMEPIILTLAQYRKLQEICDRIRPLVGKSAGELKEFDGTKLADWEEDQIKLYLPD